MAPSLAHFALLVLCSKATAAGPKAPPGAVTANGAQDVVDATWAQLSGTSPGSGVASVQFNPPSPNMYVYVNWKDLSAPSSTFRVFCCTTAPGTGTAGPATSPAPSFPNSTTNVFRASLGLNGESATAPGGFDTGFFAAHGATFAGAYAALVAGVRGGKAYVVLETTDPAVSLSGFLKVLPDICTLNGATLTLTAGTPASLSRGYFSGDELCSVDIVVPNNHVLKVQTVAIDVDEASEFYLLEGLDVTVGTLIASSWSPNGPRQEFVSYSAGPVISWDWYCVENPLGLAGWWAIYEAVSIPAPTLLETAEICDVDGLALLATAGQNATLQHTASSVGGFCSVWLVAPAYCTVQITYTEFSSATTYDGINAMLGPIPSDNLVIAMPDPPVMVSLGDRLFIRLLDWQGDGVNFTLQYEVVDCKSPFPSPSFSPGYQQTIMATGKTQLSVNTTFSDHWVYEVLAVGPPSLSLTYTCNRNVKPPLTQRVLVYQSSAAASHPLACQAVQVQFLNCAPYAITKSCRADSVFLADNKFQPLAMGRGSVSLAIQAAPSRSRSASPRPSPQRLCRKFWGYKEHEDHDHFGDDLLQFSKDLAQAQAQCGGNTKCRGFNSDGRGKRVGTPNQYAKGKCLYEKDVAVFKDATIEDAPASAIAAAPADSVPWGSIGAAMGVVVGVLASVLVSVIVWSRRRNNIQTDDLIVEPRQDPRRPPMPTAVPTPSPATAEMSTPEAHSKP